MPSSNSYTPIRVDSLNRAKELFKIRQRFPHPHKHDIVDLLTSFRLNLYNLFDNFTGSQVTSPSVQPAGTEFTAVGAPHLGRDTKRLTICGQPIQIWAGWNKNRFDQISVEEREEKFARRIFGAGLLHLAQTEKPEMCFQLTTQRVRQIGHLGKFPHPFPIDPFKDLTCPIVGLTPLVQPRNEVSRCQIENGWPAFAHPIRSPEARLMTNDR